MNLIINASGLLFIVLISALIGDPVSFGEAMIIWFLGLLILRKEPQP